MRNLSMIFTVCSSMLHGYVAMASVQTVRPVKGTKQLQTTYCVSDVSTCGYQTHTAKLAASMS